MTSDQPRQFGSENGQVVINITGTFRTYEGATIHNLFVRGTTGPAPPTGHTPQPSQPSPVPPQPEVVAVAPFPEPKLLKRMTIFHPETGMETAACEPDHLTVDLEKLYEREKREVYRRFGRSGKNKKRNEERKRALGVIWFKYHRLSEVRKYQLRTTAF